MKHAKQPANAATHSQNSRSPFDGINRRGFLKLCAASSLAGLLTGCTPSRQRANTSGYRPNFIIFLTDDQGFADIGLKRANLNTPNMDKLAQQGRMFSDFYVTASVCAPSRASLMTGCYPLRVGVSWNINADMDIGMPLEEQTIAEVLKTRSYRTSCIGKWHLGHVKKYLPTRQGFDEYFGIPYSHDMKPQSAQTYPQWADIIGKYPLLPLMKDEKIIEKDPDPSTLTKRYTQKALSFIEKNKSNPFFLYMAHSMPHVPLACSEEFRGKSGRGLYADVLLELDDSLGQIVRKLRDLDIDRDTCIVFLSDNGPWLAMGNHAGSALPFREGKGTTFEGGHRVPCIVWWPGKVPEASHCNSMVTAMDLLPTFATIAGAKLPDHKIDGKNISKHFFQTPCPESPHDAVFFYHNKELQAVRSGKWKLHFPHGYTDVIKPGKEGTYGKTEIAYTKIALYDIENDPGETNNLAVREKDIVVKLLNKTIPMRKDLGDELTNTPASGRRHEVDIPQY